MTVEAPVEIPYSFSDSGTEQVSESWWLVFDDPELNALIDSALTSNFDLKTAWQRLKAAQALARRESASLFPSLDGTASAEINNRQSEFQQSQRFRLGLYSEYEVDLWGRIDAQVDASRYYAEAEAETYDAALVSLTSEIARTWYQFQEAAGQLALAESQVETNEKMLRLLKARFGTGQVRSVDILRQVQLMESTREQQYNAAAALGVLKMELAVMLGTTPQDFVPPQTDPLPELPPLPAAGIPAELISRRPDIQSSFYLLQAADRELAAALSNRYPRLSLSASVSTASYDVEDLFSDWGRSLAGNLLAPVFRGGELQAEAERAEAVKLQRLNDYAQSILTAFREVEQALLLEKQQQLILESLERQVELAVKTNGQLRTEYLHGMSNYLDVLTALNQEQELKRALLNAKLRLIEYRIGLYRALAGGFNGEEQTVDNDGLN